MSYVDALNDNIKTGQLNGMTVYYPLCHVCGEPMLTYSYRPNLTFTCKGCKLDKYLSDKENRVIATHELKERKFQNAVSRFKKVKKNIKCYTTAFEKIHNKLFTDGWFDSTEEIMVAIELVKNNIKARHQVKLGRYKADFVLPDEKIVLEVDGVLYHNKNTEQKEQIRDNLICLALGSEWDVIRISDELINTNITRLVPAFRKVKENRNLIRQQHGGVIPDWYSKKSNLIIFSPVCRGIPRKHT